MSNVIKFKQKPKVLTSLMAGEQFEDSNYAQIRNKETENKRELERHFDMGFNEGYAAAKRELERDFQNNLNRKTDEFYHILASFEDKLTSFEEAFNTIVSEASIMIAEKIVHNEVTKRDLIKNTLLDCLRRVIGTNEVIIKINPSDLESLKNTGEISEISGSFNKIRFEPNEGIEPGGCFIETDIGNIDARIRSQFESISRSLEHCFDDEEE